MSAQGNKNASLSFDPNFDVEVEEPSKSAAPATQVSNDSTSQKPAAAASTTTSEDEARKAKLKAALASVSSYQPESVPLSASGSYTPAQAQPKSQPQYYDEDYPEDFEGFSDGDVSRDLCSFPCINCGAVPSFAMYELCGKCLDEMSPT